MVAIKRYLLQRIKPLKKKDKDRLIIIAKGSHYGHAPQNGRGDYVYNTTKRIAARAGFKRSIYPYLIKPSVITNDLNNRVNPRIVQRKARHRKIESTLRYDHCSDEMIREHFERNMAHRSETSASSKNQHSPSQWSIPVDNELKSGTHNRVEKVLDRYLAGDLDAQTFKNIIGLLNPEHHTEKRDMAYS
jgi:hypothetical protein